MLKVKAEVIVDEFPVSRGILGFFLGAVKNKVAGLCVFVSAPCKHSGRGLKSYEKMTVGGIGKGEIEISTASAIKLDYSDEHNTSKSRIDQLIIIIYHCKEYFNMIN